MPGMIDRVIEEIERTGLKPKGARTIGAMADLVPLDQIAKITRLFNAPYKNSFGSTETGGPPAGRGVIPVGDKLGSVGRECIGSAPIRLLDENGNEVPDGQPGELYSRTPYTFDGYWNLPDKTAEAFRDGACSVGDMALRDGDGYIRLIDRKKNMIISGGENIYPSEVEGLLGGHPKVKDVAVVGVPDPKWGEAVHAVIVLHAGATATEAEILDWCRDRIAGFKRPRAVTFLREEQMPRTATGKVLHRELRDLLAAQPADRR